MLQEADPRSAAAEALAKRRAAVEQRLLQQVAQRSARRQKPATYPITLPYWHLTPAQRQERREIGQDVLRCINQWALSDWLGERHRRFLEVLANRLRTSHCTAAIGPAEWESFWTIRDQLP
jgi:hypothetical protein